MKPKDKGTNPFHRHIFPVQRVLLCNPDGSGTWGPMAHEFDVVGIHLGVESHLPGRRTADDKKPEPFPASSEDEVIQKIVDVLLDVMDAGATDYCCAPIGDDACARRLGHEGECSREEEPSPDQDKDKNHVR